MLIDYSSQKNGITFLEYLHFFSTNPDFVKKFDRLQGTSILPRNISPFEKMIDEATGKSKDEIKQLVEFIWHTFLAWPNSQA
jgi:hypothetical protein